MNLALFPHQMIVPLDNDDNNKGQITHYHFCSSSFPSLLHNQATIHSQRFVSKIRKREKLVPHFVIIQRASFNSHSQLPACLYSFHLTVLFRPPCVPYVTVYWSGHPFRGFIFQVIDSEGLTFVIPKCFLRVRGRVLHCWKPRGSRLVVCLSCWALRVVGGSGI